MEVKVIGRAYASDATDDGRYSEVICQKCGQSEWEYRTFKGYCCYCYYHLGYGFRELTGSVD